MAIVPTSGRQVLQRDKRARSGDRRNGYQGFFNSVAAGRRLDASGSESGRGGIRSLGTRVRNVGGERGLEPRVDLAQL